MRRICVLFISGFLSICLSQTSLAGAPTTINDFFLPGSQPLESGEIIDADGCNCHSNYDKHVEPEFTWRGGMMAQAMRDPLFTATMVIAEQDAPGSGDLCLRCHTPKGWLEGRSVPTDGSSLQTDDLDGVLCHFCHKLVKPSALGVNPYPGDANYTATTYGPDQAYLGILSALPAHSANGMYIVDSADFRRGPYVNPDAPHDFYYAPFSQDASLCGTCHDVSNPAFSRDSSGRYVPNAFNTAAPDFDPTSLLPVERTFSEWSVSAYNTAAGVYAPQFGGNLDTVRTCQDCHMRDATGKGCKRGSAPVRDDLAIHDLTGGNTFVPELIKDSYPGVVDAEALDSGIVRARRMLQLAATVDLTVAPVGGGFEATVTVTNETGHKLPSGYPEGRRLWLNLRAYNSLDSLIYESGAYDTSTAILTHDADVKVYEIKPGISPSLAPIVGETSGPSFHFVLNDTIYKDNRIPPRGFTNAAFDSIQSPPVAHSYADGQYWDITTYSLPGSSARVEAALYYQTVSKEYIDFLKLENVTDNAGDSLYTLWQNNGKSFPELMGADSATVTPNDDTDGDGVPDSLDNCPTVHNPTQTDDDDDEFGAACDCDDTDSLINPNTVWYADTDGDGYGDTASTLTQCNQPADYVLDSTDCDDADPAIHPATVWYADTDGDGYGDTASTLTQCGQPADYVLDSTDCDDTDPAINPATVWFADTDGDGYGDTASTLTQCEQPADYVLDSTDCDDTDPAINPATVWYADTDGDGYGDTASTLTQCNQPADYVLDSTDCDDTDPAINPATVWYADTDGDGYGDTASTLTQCEPPADYVLDNTDCDDTDPAIHPATVWYADTDGDGYGDTASTLTQCEQPSDYVLDSTDCDDTDPAINPTTVWYADTDGDGYGDTASTLTQCEQPTDYVLDSTDCDDTDPAINPATVWYEDSDEDTFGNPAVTLTQCEQPTGYVLDSADCDDTNPDIHPDITVYADSDGDTYGDPNVTAVVCSPPVGWVLDNTDCNDNDSTIHPLATEVCNGVDDNCSGVSDEGLADTDNDGWGAACDNCPDDFNPGQEDADSNGVGDACDVAACPIAITGDVNLTGDLTSSDIIYLVNYIFKAGAVPMPCAAAGDVNCTGSVTSADIISLVGFVFKGGDPPCDACTLLGDVWTCP